MSLNFEPYLVEYDANIRTTIFRARLVLVAAKQLPSSHPFHAHQIILSRLSGDPSEIPYYLLELWTEHGSHAILHLGDRYGMAIEADAHIDPYNGWLLIRGGIFDPQFSVIRLTTADRQFIESAIKSSLSNL